MKIAISGKGGVGKSTVAAALAMTLAGRGEKVLAFDADPDANLAAALGMPKDAAPAPISAQIALIEERTGVKIDSYGQIFKMNPDVSDVAGRFAVNWKGVDVLTLGAVRKGGGGCACPAGAFAKALVTDLVMYKNQTLIMDMEAGVEHLGRGTARSVDVMLVVAEPGQRSVECAETVARMCGEIGIKRLGYVGNKIASPADAEYLAEALGAQIGASGETTGGEAVGSGAAGGAARSDRAAAGGGAVGGETCSDRAAVGGEAHDSLTGYEAAGGAIPLIALIPYNDALRLADRPGVSVMDAADGAFKEQIERILQWVTYAR